MLGSELQKIFYGDFVPPKEVDVRKHRIGLSGGHRYIPPAKPMIVTQRERNGGLNLSEKKMLDYVTKVGKETNAVEAMAKLKMTRNHCGILLTKLFELGYLKRHKIKYKGTRMYMYSLKEKSCQ